MRTLVPVLFLLIVHPVAGQDIIDHNSIQSQLPGENAIFLKKKESAEIILVGDSIKVKTKVYEDLLVLNDKGSVYNERSVYFSHFEKINGLEARTLSPEGKTYKTVKVTDFKTTNDLGQGVFYDDHQAINFVFPSLKPGARAVFNYEELQNEPRFFGVYFFGSYLETKDSEYEVKVPANVKIRFKLFGRDTAKIRFTETKTKKGTTYSWKASNVKKYETADGAPNIRYYVPHVILYIDEVSSNGETKKILSGPEQLYQWYYSLVKGVNLDKNEEMQKLADSLVAGTKTEYEKVQRIFYWVQDNIKYVAFEDGLGGFIPREASKVCQRRYGDCKDMASIITHMLRHAGVKAYLTWIGSRDIPYNYKDVPTPQSDNHMIATWISPEGKYYFLDATGKNAPIEMFTSMIQGKEAMIGIAPEKMIVVKVPEIEKEKNMVRDEVILTVNGTSLKGTGRYIAEGYEKIRFGERLQNMTDEDMVKFLKSYLQKGNNKFSADSLNYENIRDRYKPLSMNYYFSLPDYLKVNGDEFYVNLHIDKSNQNAILDPEKRKVGLELDFKSVDVHVTKMIIPSGYDATYLPPDVSYDGKKFGFSITYKKQDGAVVAEKKFYTDSLLIAEEDFPEWNKMIKILNAAYNESIILKKKA